MDRLTQMTVFASVVDHGSFTEAAGALGIAKSTVSRHVSALEERLGVRLLNRTTRQLHTTDIGRAYYERCARIVSDAAEADRAVTDQSDTPLGTLRMTAPKGWAGPYLFPVVGEYMARFPEVDVEVHLDDRIVDIIDEGFDLAIRVARPTDSGLVAKKLGQSWHIVVAAPSYLERYGVPEHPDDLAEHRLCGRLGGGEPVTLAHGGEEFRWPRETAFASNDGNAMIDAVCTGVSIAALPDFMARRHLKAGTLVRVLPDWTDEPRPVMALYPHRRLLSSKVRTFLDLLGERVGSPAGWECPSGDCGKR